VSYLHAYVSKLHSCVWKSHSAYKITHCGLKSHSACGNNTLRVEITLFHVEITLVRVSKLHHLHHRKKHLQTQYEKIYNCWPSYFFRFLGREVSKPPTLNLSIFCSLTLFRLPTKGYLLPIFGGILFNSKKF
jgi:hypothetical protein